MKDVIRWGTPKQIQRERSDRKSHACHSGQKNRKAKGYTPRMLRDRLKSALARHKEHFGPEERERRGKELDLDKHWEKFYENWYNDSVKNVRKIAMELIKKRGHEVACYIAIMEKPPTVKVHTSNPIGEKRIKGILRGEA